MKIEPIWFGVLADLLINLSAGWFGAVVIVPNFSGLWWPYNLVVLTGDVLSGTLSLVIAFRLRKWLKEKQ